MENEPFAVVMSGGSQPSEDIFYSDFIQRADFSIAADSGLEVFLRLQLRPDLLVGDLDSLSQHGQNIARQQQIHTQKFSCNKDKTDTELALDIAIQKGYRRVLILGGIGSRLDHTIANLYLLTYADRNHTQASLHNPWHNIYLLTPENPKSIVGNVGDIVSLQAISEEIEGVTLHGLQWSLENATIQRGQSQGVSNILTHPPAQLSITKGSAFVFQVKEIL